MGKRSATNGKAPRSRQNQSKAAPLKERIVREKEDEELELEERLFGTKRRRIAQPAQAGEEEDAEGAFGELDDDQVRLLLIVKLSGLWHSGKLTCPVVHH